MNQKSIPYPRGLAIYYHFQFDQIHWRVSEKSPINLSLVPNPFQSCLLLDAAKRDVIKNWLREPAKGGPNPIAMWCNGIGLPQNSPSRHVYQILTCPWRFLNPARALYIKWLMIKKTRNSHSHVKLWTLLTALHFLGIPFANNGDSPIG